MILTVRRGPRHHGGIVRQEVRQALAERDDRRRLAEPLALVDGALMAAPRARPELLDRQRQVDRDGRAGGLGDAGHGQARRQLIEEWMGTQEERPGPQ